MIDIFSWVCILVGGFFCFSSALGLVRFPDFFCRIHAAGVTDTLGGPLILVGLMFQADWQWLVILKLLMIVILIFLTSPISSHALAKAALEGGLKPILAGNRSSES